MPRRLGFGDQTMIKREELEGAKFKVVSVRKKIFTCSICEKRCSKFRTAVKVVGEKDPRGLHGNQHICHTCFMQLIKEWDKRKGRHICCAAQNETTLSVLRDLRTDKVLCRRCTERTLDTQHKAYVERIGTNSAKDIANGLPNKKPKVWDEQSSAPHYVLERRDGGAVIMNSEELKHTLAFLIKNMGLTEKLQRALDMAGFTLDDLEGRL